MVGKREPSEASCVVCEEEIKLGKGKKIPLVKEQIDQSMHC